MKRYRMTASATFRAEQYAERVMPLLGTVRRVVASRFTSTQTARWRENGKIRKGTLTTWREYVTVYGDNGSARFNGVCWGYGGGGPQAVHKILLLAGLPADEAWDLAFRSPRLDKDGISWEWKRAAQEEAA